MVRSKTFPFQKASASGKRSFGKEIRGRKVGKYEENGKATNEKLGSCGVSPV